MRFVTLLLEYFSSLVEVFLCAATAHAEISLRTDYVCENNQMVSGQSVGYSILYDQVCGISCYS